MHVVQFLPSDINSKELEKLLKNPFSGGVKKGEKSVIVYIQAYHIQALFSGLRQDFSLSGFG